MCLALAAVAPGSTDSRTEMIFTCHSGLASESQYTCGAVQGGAAKPSPLCDGPGITPPNECAQEPLGEKFDDAKRYSVLAGSTVTNTGPTNVNTGDLGVSPGSAVTGFPPGKVVEGKMDKANAASAAGQVSLSKSPHRILWALAPSLPFALHVPFLRWVATLNYSLPDPATTQLHRTTTSLVAPSARKPKSAKLEVRAPFMLHTHLDKPCGFDVPHQTSIVVRIQQFPLQRLDSVVALAGTTITPGLYKSTSGMQVTAGDLTLDAEGDTEAIFIFQMASTFVIASSRKIVLINGAKPGNVFWQVGSSGTLGTYTSFQGTMMADQAISVKTGAAVDGRVLARIAAVTLDDNEITKPSEVAPPTPLA